jgi:hypothetical protein
VTRRRVTIGLIVAVVLLGVLVAADRIGAALATNAAQRYLAQQAFFTDPPKVELAGFPFLTQAAEGRYDEITVRSAAIELNGVPAIDLDAHLHGVHLPLSDALGGSVQSLPVDSVDGSVTFDYAEVAKLSQISGLALTESDGQLHVSANLTVPGLDVSGAVSGSAAPRVVDGKLVLAVTGLSVAGVSLPAAVLSQLTALLAVPIPIPALPYGLQITSLQAAPAGLVVDGRATKLVIERNAG